jgi:hypothetical protein
MCLPRDGTALAIKFHHVAIRIDGSLENWQQHRAAIDMYRSIRSCIRAVSGDMLRYFYTDERSTLGHYVEHVWMSPELLAAARDRHPHVSATKPAVTRRRE